jgi:hypothetical protein
MSVRSVSLDTTDLDDLPSVRRDLDRLVWSRGIWTACDAERYEQLTRRERELLSIGFS